MQITMPTWLQYNYYWYRCYYQDQLSYNQVPVWMRYDRSGSTDRVFIYTYDIAMD